jgi:hypothetical protein
MVLAVAACIGGLVAAAPAEARSRHHPRAAGYHPLIVPVTPRSFLDPGPIPPVGTYSRYVYASQYPNSMPYTYTHPYGRPPLPTEPPGPPTFQHLDFGPLEGP